jgi:hypothetical protein
MLISCLSVLSITQHLSNLLKGEKVHSASTRIWILISVSYRDYSVVISILSSELRSFRSESQSAARFASFELCMHQQLKHKLT